MGSRNPILHFMGPLAQFKVTINQVEGVATYVHVRSNIIFMKANESIVDNYVL